MFRLFLVNLIKSGKELEAIPSQANSLPPRRLRNRRIYERFDIDHKHLALMNEQDILLVRDLSERGFSTEVSERGFKRLVVGDIYQCRIRYLGEIYETQACVRWKSKSFVGFELTKASPKVRQFMKRLIDPLEIGASLQQMDSKFSQSADNKGMLWYQGTQETNLFVWLDETGALRSWKLENQQRIIKWHYFEGITTGKLQPVDPNLKQLTLAWEAQQVSDDSQPNKELVQFAMDIFMALQIPAKEQLLASIIG